MRRMVENPWVWLALFAAIFAVAGPASAQQGFYIGTGVGFGIPEWSGDMDDVEPDNGMGLELLHLGYNFTPKLGASLQWGSIAGEMEGDMYGYDIDEGVYGEGYMCLSGRYTFADSTLPLTPYAEFGLGTYTALAEVEIGPLDADITVESEMGLRLGFGGHYYINRFYIAPELSYHIVEFDDVEYDIDGFGDVDDDDIGDGDFMLILVKIGYHFGKE
jgi:hypothetical protein